jgi:PAS domain S-box-containing protein
MRCGGILLGTAARRFFITRIAQNDQWGLEAIGDARGLLVGLFEHAPVAFQVYRADGSCLLVNEAFRRLFGSAPPPEYNVLQDDVLEQQGFLELIRRAFAGETVHVPAHWYDPRDLRQLDVREGRRVGIEVTLFPLSNAEARPDHVALCFKDVTAELELKLAATALEFTEQRFRSTFEQAAVGVAHVSPEGKWLDVNQRLCAIVGYSHEELLGLTFQELTYPPDLSIDLEFVRKLLAGELDSYSLEKRYVRRDGTLLWIHLSVSLVRKESGAPSYFISVIQDISARKKVDEDLTSTTRSLQAEVAERKRVEEALRESEESLSTTLDSIADAVIATDTTGRVLRMNPAAEALTGFRLSEARGQNLADVFHVLHEGTGLAADSPVDRVLRDRVPLAFAAQTLLVARDGTVRAIADNAAPIRDAEGRIRGAVLVFRDQTAARASERLLAESEARKGAILEAALDCIVAMDHQGLITEFNPAAERTFGFARADVLGKPLVELIVPPSLRAQHQQGMLRYLKSGIGPILGKRIELQALRADGSEFPVELAVVPTGSGQPMFTSYIRDITERRQAAAALRASQDRLRHLDESGIIGVIVTDSQGNVLEANEAFLEIVGFTREELLHRQTGRRGTTPPEWWPNDESALQQFKKTGILAPREKSYLRKDGTLAPVLVGAAMLDEHRWVAFVLNLSDQKRAEDESARALKTAESESAHRERAEEAVRGLEEQLRQSQKLEAIGTLAGGIAHDFNNLLSVILSYSDLMLRELNAADPMHADLQQIARAGKAAGDLTHQLLAFSRQQLLQPKILNLNDTIAGINRMLQRLIGEDIELSFVPGTKLGTVFVDPGQIEQVLLNLVVNARDAMPTGVDRRHERRRTRPDLCQRPPGRETGAVRDGERERHRRGHGPRDSKSHFRAIFHDQRDRQGNGARALYGVRNRAPKRR